MTAILPKSASADNGPFRWSRALFDQATASGLFEGLRIELINGEIVQMSPINYLHVQGCTLTAELLKAAFGPAYFVLVQCPLGVGESEPQPDLSVIRGTPRDFKDHPTTAALVVEVADASLSYDMGDKVSLYASANIPEYWILDLNNRQLIVYRNPKPAPHDPRARFGHLYTQIQTLSAEDCITPQGAPRGVLKISDMLP